MPTAVTHIVTHDDDEATRTVRSSCSCGWSAPTAYVPGRRDAGMSVALAAGASHLDSQRFAGVL